MKYQTCIICSYFDTGCSHKMKYLSTIPFKLCSLPVCFVYRKRENVSVLIGENLTIKQAYDKAVRCATCCGQTALLKLGDAEIEISWKEPTDKDAGKYLATENGQRVNNLQKRLTELLKGCKKCG